MANSTEHTENKDQITEEQMAHGLNIDENMAGTELLNDELTDNGEDATNELAEARDKYLRLAAEFENYKRRTSKERVELKATAGREIVESLLDVLDDSDRAIKQLDTSNDPEIIKGGIMLVFNKLKNTLQQKGLTMMESHGKDFNADLHEAISEIPTGDDKNAGKIVDVVTPGYYLNDKLIRHAKVVVGK